MRIYKVTVKIIEVKHVYIILANHLEEALGLIHETVNKKWLTHIELMEVDPNNTQVIPICAYLTFGEVDWPQED